jgi:voltage-gated potassium channel
VPTTSISRAFAVVMVIVGFTVFSLVTASVSALFVGEDERRLRREMHQNVLELRREIAEMRAELQRHGLISPDESPMDVAKKSPSNEEI